MVEVTRVTVVFSLYVSEAPVVKSAGGYYITPHKITVELRGDKMRAVVFGPTKSAGAWRSTNFNIKGYKYKECPEWIRHVISRTMVKEF